MTCSRFSVNVRQISHFTQTQINFASVIVKRPLLHVRLHPSSTRGMLIQVQVKLLVLLLTSIAYSGVDLVAELILATSPSNTKRLFVELFPRCTPIALGLKEKQAYSSNGPGATPEQFLFCQSNAECKLRCRYGTIPFSPLNARTLSYKILQDLYVHTR